MEYMCVLTNVISSNGDEDVKIRAVFHREKFYLLKRTIQSYECAAAEITIAGVRAHIRES